MTVDNTAEHDQSSLVRSYSVLTGICSNIQNKYGIVIEQIWYTSMPADITANPDPNHLVRIYSVPIDILTHSDRSI